MASMAARSGTRGLWHPQGCCFRGGSNGSIFAQSSSGIRHLSPLTACFIAGIPLLNHPTMKFSVGPPKVSTGLGSYGLLTRFPAIVAVVGPKCSGVAS